MTGGDEDVQGRVARGDAPPIDPESDPILDPTARSAYRSWARRQPRSSESYLFDEPRVRFAAEDSDVLVAQPNVEVIARAGTLLLLGPQSQAPSELPGLEEADGPAMRSLLSLCDGTRTMAELRTSSPMAAARLSEVVEAALGRHLFAPLALSACQRRAPALEIVRFPRSPYEIERRYWCNAGDVRQELSEAPLPLDDTPRFLRRLRELHVTLLTGQSRSSHYLPRSPIGARRADPGRLYQTPCVLRPAEDHFVVVSGPRVNAAPVGGARYHALMWESLDDPAAGEPREHRAAGLDWGRCIRGRAESESTPGRWFCPPRPTTLVHFDHLRTRLLLARQTNDEHRRASALADFHQSFVRLHPFSCGNQSLAMSVVNHELAHARGAGIPHLVLDHFALCVTRDAYAALFRRALEAYRLPDGSAARQFVEIAGRCQHAFELVDEIARAESLEEARALVEKNSDRARYALLR